MEPCEEKENITSLTHVEEWWEQTSLWGFRLWHIIFMFVAAVLTTTIFLCCCIRFRIPRTKQEIEADYIRKKLAAKFQKKLKMIKNSDMDEMDLKKALDRIRAEFRSDTESLAQSEALSVGSVCSSALPLSPLEEAISSTKQNQIDVGNLTERRESGLGARLSTFFGITGLMHRKTTSQAPEKSTHV